MYMIYETSGHYWLLGSSATLQSAYNMSVRSLCPWVWSNSGLAGWILMKFDMGEFTKTWQQFKFSLRSDFICWPTIVSARIWWVTLNIWRRDKCVKQTIYRELKHTRYVKCTVSVNLKGFETITQSYVMSTFTKMPTGPWNPEDNRNHEEI
jgi:hypothetical protein